MKRSLAVLSAIALLAFATPGAALAGDVTGSISADTGAAVSGATGALGLGANAGANANVNADVATKHHTRDRHDLQANVSSKTQAKADSEIRRKGAARMSGGALTKTEIEAAGD